MEVNAEGEVSVKDKTGFDVPHEELMNGGQKVGDEFVEDTVQTPIKYAEEECSLERL